MEENIQGSRHAIKFIAQFVAALLKVRTSNLVKIANAFDTDIESSSVNRQIQRFLRNENKVSVDYLKLSKAGGKLKIVLDRTEWRFGSVWVNILCLSVAYKNVAIPVLWEGTVHKGNATAAEHKAIISTSARAEKAEKRCSDTIKGVSGLSPCCRKKSI
ncbi:MAG: hypothetical protein ABI686_03780 [Acidobacteriota bacterium]